MVGDQNVSPAGDVSHVVELSPEKGVLSAIGRHHTLATAVADLVDNSIDASADTVTIRFLTADARVRAIRIRDNGTGMTADKLVLAMRLGERRDYKQTDHGHFGMGLKAASLSQSRTVSVYTLVDQDIPRGIRIGRESFEGHVLTDEAAWSGFEDDIDSLGSTGTVVEWGHVENVSDASSSIERNSWLEKTITSLRGELGLTFHRLLSSGRLRISIEVFDEALLAVGARRSVQPVDPFGFKTPGHVNYPVEVNSLANDRNEFNATFYLLPPSSKSASSNLLGRPRTDWQGFYVYRNDRLIHASGWLGQEHNDKRLQLARVSVDLSPRLEKVLRINHEKHGVRPLEGFGVSLQSARSSTGLNFSKFLDDARDVFQLANKRHTGIKPLIPLSSGLSEDLTDALRDVIGVREGVDSISIRWCGLEKGRLFLFDSDSRSILINEGYRVALGGVTGDAPLIKVFAYLLLQDRFTNRNVRRVTKDEIEAWQSVLASALIEQLGESGFVEQIDSDKGRLGSGEADIGNPHFLTPDSTIEDLTPGEAPDVAENLFDVSVSSAEGVQVGGTESVNPANIAGIYRQGSTVAETALQLALDPTFVARSLCLHVLGLQEPLDDETLYPRHGLVYTPEERHRILTSYRSGVPLLRIAQDMSRTPLDIARQLLDHPSRPVQIKRSTIRRIRKKASSIGGND